MECKYNGSDRRLDYLFDNANHVEVDPIQTAGNPVADITIDGETTRLYAPAGGGGGTTVVANPPESATDTLVKLQVDNIVYDVQAGSGGGSAMMSDYHSTEERVVGRWTDGKPLYQKTIKNVSYSGVNTRTWMDVVDLSNDSIDEVVDIKGTAILASSGCVYIINHHDNVIYFDVVYENSKLQMVYDTKANGGGTIDVTFQYTKTTDAAGTGPTPGNLIYLPALYSEEEREVGVWTDGKPLYQKTIIFSNPVYDTSWHSVAHNIDYVDNIFIDGGYIENTYKERYSFSAHRPVQSIGVITGVTSTDILYMNNWQDNAVKMVITLQYTKTTDTPGSGKYLPDGSYSHHYSSTEQVVGTWIDGSTVYEKVITLDTNLVTNNTSWSYVSYSNQLTNIDRLISCAPLDGTDSYLIGRFCVDNHKLAAASVNSGTLLTAGQMLIIRYTKT